jgi:hypothetical protein
MIAKVTSIPQRIRRGPMRSSRGLCLSVGPNIGGHFALSTPGLAEFGESRWRRRLWMEESRDVAIPLVGRDPFPTKDRSVSGRNRIRIVKKAALYIVRNQNIALHPNVSEKTPPRTGPTAKGASNPA